MSPDPAGGVTMGRPSTSPLEHNIGEARAVDSAGLAKEARSQPWAGLLQRRAVIEHGGQPFIGRSVRGTSAGIYS